MLYLTLAAIFIGSCAIETRACRDDGPPVKLVVTFISDKPPKKVTMDAETVYPTRDGIGCTIPQETMNATFPEIDFRIKLNEQFIVTWEGKTNNDLTVAHNMAFRLANNEESPDPDSLDPPPPSYVVATTMAGFYWLHHNDAVNILERRFYFEATEEKAANKEASQEKEANKEDANKEANKEDANKEANKEEEANKEATKQEETNKKANK